MRGFYEHSQGISGGISSGYPLDIKHGEKVSLDKDNHIIKLSKDEKSFYGIFTGITWIDKNGIPRSQDDWIPETTYDENNPIYAWIKKGQFMDNYWKNCGREALGLPLEISEIDELKDRIKWLERIIFLQQIKYNESSNKQRGCEHDEENLIEAYMQSAEFMAIHTNDAMKRLSVEWEKSKNAWRKETGLDVYKESLRWTHDVDSNQYKPIEE